MVPDQQPDDEPMLYDTIRERMTPSSETPLWSAIEETSVVLATAAVGMTMLASPAAAQTQELGNALCSSGAGWVAMAAGVLAAIYLMGKGGARGVGALDDVGSHKEETRRKGRQEAKGAATSFAGGLVGVPFVGALLGQLLPDSFGCLGFELNLLLITAFPF